MLTRNQLESIIKEAGYGLEKKALSGKAIGQAIKGLLSKGQYQRAYNLGTRLHGRNVGKLEALSEQIQMFPHRANKPVWERALKMTNNKVENSDLLNSYIHRLRGTTYSKDAWNNAYNASKQISINKLKNHETKTQIRDISKLIDSINL